MKQQPITFRETYSESSNSRGFKPISDGNSEWIFERTIEVEPAFWKHGTMIIFRILEKYSKNGLVQSHLRKVCEVCCYDKDIEDWSIKEHINNLATGDLRGRAAENTAHSLMIKLFVQTEECKEFLPEVTKFYEKFNAKTTTFNCES